MLSVFSKQTMSYSPVTSYTSVTSESLTRPSVTVSSSRDSTNRFRMTMTSFGRGCPSGSNPELFEPLIKRPAIESQLLPTGEALRRC
jgi:hypothetical protein